VRVTAGAVEEADGAVRISQSFMLEHPRAAVWALMSNPEAVAHCIPGARLDGPPQDGRIAGRIDVRLGPIVAGFAGEGTLTQIPSEYLQRIEGRAADRGSGSRVSGRIEYRLTACAGAAGGEATRVDVVIAYALTGLLAQLGRSTLARELAQSLGDTFAQNLDLRLSGPLGALPRPDQVQLSALPLLLAALRARLRALLARLLRS
jgi:carbon-monoxide dehydrogenase small subunit